MIGITAIISSITSMASGWLDARTLRNQAKLQSSLKLDEAKVEAQIKRMAQSASADIAWENLSITNSGWKDEWFTILLSIPMVMCFVPGGAQYVQAGFEALNASTPEWYQWAFLVAVGSSFGVRKLTDFMSLRKGA